MSWASEMFERAMRRARGRDDAVEFAIRETIEECARRAHGVAANWPPHGTGPVGARAVRDQILAMLEDT